MSDSGESAPGESDALWLRLKAVFGHRPETRIVKAEKAWKSLRHTVTVSAEEVELVEEWYRAKKETPHLRLSGQAFWARTHLETLLNNWVGDLAYIRSSIDLLRHAKKKITPPPLRTFGGPTPDEEERASLYLGG